MTATTEDVVHAPAAHAEGHHTSTGISNAKLGMWAFLGSDCLLFGGLISTFLIMRSKEVVRGFPVSDIYDIPFTSVSSFVLLMSSMTMVLALSGIQRGDHRRARTWILTTALLGLVFTLNLQSSAFYVLTGFHGVHVTVGILMLLSLYVMSLRGHLPTERSETVEIVGLYWHFVDVVWILIFTVVYLIF
jgi:heme/copper-type cytochrome/quinol oxidase subunit 3